MIDKAMDLKKVGDDVVEVDAAHPDSAKLSGDCEICGAWCGSLVRGVCQHCQKRYGLE